MNLTWEERTNGYKKTEQHAPKMTRDALTPGKPSPKDHAEIKRRGEAGDASKYIARHAAKERRSIRDGG